MRIVAKHFIRGSQSNDARLTTSTARHRSHQQRTTKSRLSVAFTLVLTFLAGFLISLPQVAQAATSTPTNPVLFEARGEAYGESIKYYLMVTDVYNQNYQTMIISYPKELDMILPTATGSIPYIWNLTTTTGDVNVTVNFNIKSGVRTAAQLKTDLESISFLLKDSQTLPPENSKISVTASASKMSSYTDPDGYAHWYKFIPFDDHNEIGGTAINTQDGGSNCGNAGCVTWWEAYNMAKTKWIQDPRHPDDPNAKLYGYLATITSEEEQITVYKSIADYGGWLGGTRMRRNGAIINDPQSIPNYDDGTVKWPANYNTTTGKFARPSDYAPISWPANTTSSTRITTDTQVTKQYQKSYAQGPTWYWADGPEAGQVFYNQPSFGPLSSGVPQVSGHTWAAASATPGAQAWDYSINATCSGGWKNPIVDPDKDMVASNCNSGFTAGKYNNFANYVHGWIHVFGEDSTTHNKTYFGKRRPYGFTEASWSTPDSIAADGTTAELGNVVDMNTSNNSQAREPNGADGVEYVLQFAYPGRCYGNGGATKAASGGACGKDSTTTSLMTDYPTGYGDDKYPPVTNAASNFGQAFRRIDTWNDYAGFNAGSLYGYYVEFGGYPTDPLESEIGDAIETAAEIDVPLPVQVQYRSDKVIGTEPSGYKLYAQMSGIGADKDYRLSYINQKPFNVPRNDGATSAVPAHCSTNNPAHNTEALCQAAGASWIGDEPDRPAVPAGYEYYGWYYAGDARDEANTALQGNGSINGEFSSRPQRIVFLYRAKDYTLTFDPNFPGANSSNVTPGSKTVKYDNEYGELAVATRPGYKFVGWFTKPTGGIPAVPAYCDNNDPFTGVPKDANDCDDPANFVARVPNDEVNEDDLYLIDGDSTVYAYWTMKKDYTVQYDLDGGTCDSTDSWCTARELTGVSWDQDSLVPTSEKPTKTDEQGSYVFVGWRVSENGKTDANVTPDQTYGDLAASPTEPDIVLQAQWRPAWLIQVIYHLNGGITVDPSDDDTIPDQLVEETDPVELPTPDPIRPGYRFLGWLEVDNGNGESATDVLDPNEENIYGDLAYWPTRPDGEPSKFIILEAQWESITYQLEYRDGDDASLYGSAVSHLWEDNGLTPKPNGDPTKTHQVFMGWNTAQDGTGTWASPFTTYAQVFNANGDPTSGVATLYAQWMDAVQYTVKFDLNGGTAAPNNTYTDRSVYLDDPLSDNPDGFPDNPIPPTGYNFVGWAVVYNGAKSPVTGADTFGGLATDPNLGYITLRAQYSAINYYTVSYNVNGGTWTAPKFCPVGVQYPHPDCTLVYQPGISWSQNHLLPNAADPVWVQTTGTLNGQTCSTTTPCTVKTFVGWSTTSSGTGGVVATDAKTFGELAGGNPAVNQATGVAAGVMCMINGVSQVCPGITLYAQWVDASNYTVIWDLNGGSGTAANWTAPLTGSIGDPSAIVSTLPSWDTDPNTSTPTPPIGYEFVRWEVIDNGHGDITRTVVDGTKRFNELSLGMPRCTKTTPAVPGYCTGGNRTINHFGSETDADCPGSSTLISQGTAAIVTTAALQSPNFNSCPSGFDYSALVTPGWSPVVRAQAIYQEISDYTVVYDWNYDGVAGGDDYTEQREDVHWTETGLVPLVPAPTRPGFTFAGWTTDPAGATTPIIATDPYSKLVSNDPTVKTATLYAKWTPASFIVRYDTNGGTVPSGGDPSSYDNRTVAYTDANLLPVDPVRTGYTLTGWKVTANGKVTRNVLDTDSYGDLATSGAIYITLTAQWAEKTFTVHYDTNGADSPAIADRTDARWWTSNLLPAQPVRAGYTFAGWKVVDVYDSTPGNTPYVTATVTNADRYSTLARTSVDDTHEWSDIKLQAQWTAKTYTVNYDLTSCPTIAAPGATTSLAAKTGIAWTGGDLLPGSAPVCPGYVLTGWTQTLAGTTPASAAVTGSSAYNTLVPNDNTMSITVAPVWTETTTPVTYTYLAQSFASDGTTAQSSAAAITSGGSVAPTTGSLLPVSGNPSLVTSTASASAGYHFVGWYDETLTTRVSEDLTFTPVKVGGMFPGGTFVAKFVEDIVTIDYAAATGGTVSSATEGVAVVTGTPAGSVATPAPGYVFDRWCATADYNPLDPTSCTGVQTTASATLVPAKVGGVNVAGSYTAVFVQAPAVNITYAPKTVDASGALLTGVAADHGGTVSSPGESVLPLTGTAQGSTAIAHTGFDFVKWCTAADFASNFGDCTPLATTTAFVPAQVDGVNVAGSYVAVFFELGNTLPPVEPDATGTLYLTKLANPSTVHEPTGQQDTGDGTPLGGIPFEVCRVTAGPGPDDGSGPTTVTLPHGPRVADWWAQAARMVAEFVPASIPANAPETFAAGERGAYSVTDCQTGVTDDATGEVLFTNLPMGLYLVREYGLTGELASYVPADPFIITLPLMSSDGSGWVRNPAYGLKAADYVDQGGRAADVATVLDYYIAYVYPKNPKPTVTKDATSVPEALAVGSPIGYTITAPIPCIPNELASGAGCNVTSLVINDTLGSGLTWVNGSNPYTAPSVRVVKGTEVVTLAETTDYTVSVAGGVMTITFTNPSALSAKAGGTVVVGLTAYVATGNDFSAGLLHNDAAVSWNNFPETSDDADVVYGGFALHKFDAVAGWTRPLAGAKFRLFASEADATQNQNPLTASWSVEQGSQSPSVETTTGSSGEVRFAGLVYNPADDGSRDCEVGGKNGTQFWAVETEAPAGYTGGTTPYPVCVTGLISDADQHDGDDLWVENVPRNAGFTLPFTGEDLNDPRAIIALAIVFAAAAFFASGTKKTTAPARKR